MSDRAVVLVLNREKILVDLLVRFSGRRRSRDVRAASVVEAMRLFEQHRPDLVIVDPAVPEGFEFMDQVRTGFKAGPDCGVRRYR